MRPRAEVRALAACPRCCAAAGQSCAGMRGLGAGGNHRARTLAALRVLALRAEVASQDEDRRTETSITR